MGGPINSPVLCVGYASITTPAFELTAPEETRASSSARSKLESGIAFFSKTSRKVSPRDGAAIASAISSIRMICAFIDDLRPGVTATDFISRIPPAAQWDCRTDDLSKHLLAGE